MKFQNNGDVNQNCNLDIVRKLWQWNIQKQERNYQKNGCIMIQILKTIMVKVQHSIYYNILTMKFLNNGDVIQNCKLTNILTMKLKLKEENNLQQ